MITTIEGQIIDLAEIKRRIKDSDGQLLHKCNIPNGDYSIISAGAHKGKRLVSCQSMDSLIIDTAEEHDFIKFLEKTYPRFK